MPVPRAPLPFSHKHIHAPHVPMQVLQQLADPDSGYQVEAGCEGEGDTAEMRFSAACALLRCAWATWVHGLRLAYGMGTMSGRAVWCMGMEASGWTDGLAT